MKTLNDLSKPNEVERDLLEKDVQEKCVAWVRKRGYWARKFSSQSQRSVPDYLFSASTPYGKIKFFCEFKRPDAKRDPITGLMSTEAQQDEQAAMRAAGWDGFECCDFEAFTKWVKNYERWTFGSMHPAA